MLSEIVHGGKKWILAIVSLLVMEQNFPFHSFNLHSHCLLLYSLLSLFPLIFTPSLPLLLLHYPSHVLFPFLHLPILHLSLFLVLSTSLPFLSVSLSPFPLCITSLFTILLSIDPSTHLLFLSLSVIYKENWACTLHLFACVHFKSVPELRLQSFFMGWAFSLVMIGHSTYPSL